MSYYTSTGITVSPEHGEEFLRILAEGGDAPDGVSRERDGSVTAVWKDRNHFESGELFARISDFLDGIGEDHFGMEIIDESWDSEVRGYYPLGFWSRIEYHLVGTPVDLGSVSRNIGPRRGARAAKAGFPARKAAAGKPAAKRSPARRKAAARKARGARR